MNKITGLKCREKWNGNYIVKGFLNGVGFHAEDTFNNLTSSINWHVLDCEDYIQSLMDEGFSSSAILNSKNKLLLTSGQSNALRCLFEYKVDITSVPSNGNWYRFTLGGGIAK